MSIELSRPSYLMRVLISLDQFAYVLAGGKRFGLTISASLGMHHRQWYRDALYYVLDEIQDRHCELAMIHDAQRDAQTVDDLTPDPPAKP